VATFVTSAVGYQSHLGAGIKCLIIQRSCCFEQLAVRRRVRAANTLRERDWTAAATRGSAWRRRHAAGGRCPKPAAATNASRVVNSLRRETINA